MQSRCVVLIMRRATAAETKRLVDFDETHEEALTVCGRKFARWASDLEALPMIDKTPTGLINRIWLNWRTLLQIAELAGGTWPARALAAAKADMARVTRRAGRHREYALLAAIWRVLAADKSDPRRMLTQDLIPKLYDEDEGRWRTAGRGGKPIDEYYLRSKLKKLLPDTRGVFKAVFAPLAGRWEPQGQCAIWVPGVAFCGCFRAVPRQGLALGQAPTSGRRPRRRRPNPDPRKSIPPGGGSLSGFIRHIRHKCQNEN